MIAGTVNHISFTVSDLEKSLAFYRDILGLTPVERPDLGIPGAWLSAGNAEVHLIGKLEGVDTGAPPEKLSPLANHNAFAVDDYQQTADYLKAKGLEVLETSPERGPLWVQDPDGNVIEFISVRR